MVLRFVAFALTLLLLTPGSILSTMADDVGLSAAERAKNIKAYEARKAQGSATDTPRGGRAMKYHRMGQQPPLAQGQATDMSRDGRAMKQHRMGQQPPRAQKQHQRPQQQEQQAKRCLDAVTNAQNTAVGTSVLSSAVGFLPFGGVASGVTSAAANVGATAAGEIARQKADAAVQGNCGGMVPSSLAIEYRLT